MVASLQFRGYDRRTDRLVRSASSARGRQSGPTCSQRDPRAMAPKAVRLGAIVATFFMKDFLKRGDSTGLPCCYPETRTATGSGTAAHPRVSIRLSYVVGEIALAAIRIAG